MATNTNPNGSPTWLFPRGDIGAQSGLISKPYRQSNSAGAVASGITAQVLPSMDDMFDKYAGMIQSNTAQNNAWSAEQAQKNRDWQEKMVQTANKFNAEQAQLNRDWQEKMNSANNDYNAKEAQKNRDWQAQQAATAHQREVKDLLAAGLNPVLSAMNGNGAATTSGAYASSSGAPSGAYASSGSSPGGAVGQTDTSANGALVSLLGALVSSHVQQENARLSAQTNLAIADKYNAMSKYTAELGSATNLEMNKRSVMAQVYNGRLSAETALSTANIQATTQRFVAQLQANTSLSVAQINQAATIVSAQLHSAATRYVADKNYQSSIVTTRMNNLSAQNVAGINAQVNKALNEANIKARFDFAEAYPANGYQYDPGQANMRDWISTGTEGFRDITMGIGTLLDSLPTSSKRLVGFDRW